jgi:lipopolysaccharide/colanic/teichoic acid biosynthesis glycosyltransferase
MATDQKIEDYALSHHPRGFYQRYGKRMFDFICASFGILVLSPVMLLAAILIKLDSSGPVFYRSTRVGKHAKHFQFLKFRSMVEDAEKSRDELEHLNEMDGPVFKIRNDPRTTWSGKLIRRTSIDELPQLFHVWRGEMSLVGPRPPIPEEVVQYEPIYRRRLSVTPGITCLWQVRGRNQISFEEWMQLDREYIDNLSFAQDMKILLMTIPAVLRGIGAS